MRRGVIAAIAASTGGSFVPRSDSAELPFPSRKTGFMLMAGPFVLPILGTLPLTKRGEPFTVITGPFVLPINGTLPLTVRKTPFTLLTSI